MRKRVCCLYRVSTLKQVEKDDIPMQKQRCHEFAAQMGWEIVREFSEKGVSVRLIFSINSFSFTLNNCSTKWIKSISCFGVFSVLIKLKKLYRLISLSLPEVIYSLKRAAKDVALMYSKL